MATMTQVEKAHILELVHTITLPIVPHDIEIDRAGNLYIVEFGQARFHKFDTTGEAMVAWGGPGSGEGQFAFGPLPDASPLTGGFVTVDENGSVYVSDTYNNRVQKFDPNGAFLAMWEAKGSPSVPFETPGPISADLNGHVYVADFAGLHQFDLAGTYLRTLAAAGEVGTDSHGNRYAPFAIKNSVVKLKADGSILNVWGNAGTGDGQFDFPVFLVVDGQDHIYVADHSGRIQKFTPEGMFLGAWNDPQNGDGPMTAAVSIALGENDMLYAAGKDRNKLYVLRSVTQ